MERCPSEHSEEGLYLRRERERREAIAAMHLAQLIAKQPKESEPDDKA